MSRVFGFLLFFCATTGLATSPLAPVKTDTPRDTMRTFYEAMNDYRDGLKTNNQEKLDRIDAAVRTLNMGNMPAVSLDDKGKETAILLKEVIDRVIVLNFDYIPDERTIDGEDFWRLKDTEITIRKVENGDRKGEWLFSEDTVSRTKTFFKKVKKLGYKKGSGNGAGYREPFIERHMPEWAKKESVGLLRWQWLGIFIGILLGLIFKKLTEWAVELMRKFANRSKSDWDDKAIDAIEKPVGLISATAVWFIVLKLLRIDGLASDVLSVAIQVVFSLGMIWAFLNLTTFLTNFLRVYTRRSDFPMDDQLVPLLNRALRLFVLVFGLLISIQNLGVNVMSLLAGLGLGGLAFALAAQDTAANLFGSIMILWDQPFKAGDWIVSGDAEGTVEEIGFRSTRIRTFYDSVVSVPNSKLANANIDNMGRRKFRRVRTTLGVTYDTPPDKIKAFMDGIKEIIKGNEYTRKDYFHVVFSEFGGSSLNIMLYFFLECPDWTVELKEKESIYLDIVRLAESLGVEFAFPTQTLHVESLPPAPAT